MIHKLEKHQYHWWKLPFWSGANNCIKGKDKTVWEILAIKKEMGRV